MIFIVVVSFGVFADEPVDEGDKDFCVISENKKICIGMPMEFSDKYISNNVLEIQRRYRLLTRNKPVKITKEKEPHVIEYKTGISNEITKNFNCYGSAITYDNERKISGIIYECDPVGDGIIDEYVKSHYLSKYAGLEPKHRVVMNMCGTGKTVAIINEKFGVEFVKTARDQRGFYLFNRSEIYNGVR